MFEEVKVNSERWFQLKNLKNEIWKDLKVLKNNKLYCYTNLYKISNYGRVKSLGIFHGKTNNFFNKEHILKARTNKCGYVMYHLCDYGKSNDITVHRAVATTFISNKNNKKQVNHIDGDKSNNRVDNLEWCSASENIKHAYSTGLKISKGQSMPGEKNPNCKHSDKEIEEIRRKRRNGVKIKDIVKEYNISGSYVSLICNYKFRK